MRKQYNPGETGAGGISLNPGITLSLSIESLPFSRHKHVVLVLFAGTVTIHTVLVSITLNLEPQKALIFIFFVVAKTKSTTTTSTTKATTAATTTTITTTTTTTINQAAYELDLFVNQTLRRLTNYNRLLDKKILTFKLVFNSTEFLPNRRLIFLLPNVDDLDQYLEKKLEDKEKHDKLLNVKSVIKIFSLLVMTITFLGIIFILKAIHETKYRNYMLIKARKAKAKRKLKRKKKRIAKTETVSQ